jgi:hypothetical protein
MCNYRLKALDIRFFASLEKVDHSLSESEKIIGLLKKSIPLANSRGFDDDVLKIFKIANCFHDFFFGLADLCGRVLRVKLEPLVAWFSGLEKFAKKRLTIWIEAV